MIPWLPLLNPWPFTYPQNGQGANAGGVRSLTTLRDGRGNPPNLGILSFPLPLDLDLASQGNSLGLTQLLIYLKESGPAYTLLERAGVYGVRDYLEYHYFLLTAVVGESYAVQWRMPDGTITPPDPVDATVYFPAVPDPERARVNSQMLVREFVRRTFLVERRSGERAILMRRKTSGTACRCFNTRVQDASRECPECFGVGWEGGYDPFPRILLRFHPAGLRLQGTEAGILYDTSPRGHTVIVPEVADRDIFLRMLPRGTPFAYEVHNRTRVAKEGMAGIPTLQEFSLKALERSHPIYKAASRLLPQALLAPTTEAIAGMPEPR